MGLLLAIIIGFLLSLVVWIYVLPILKRYSQLRKDYRDISFLPISSIPFVGNLHLIDKRPPVFFQLLCRMSKICQEQDKGIFCLWYAIWPMNFLCTGKGLEVWTFSFSFLINYYVFNRLRHLLIIANNWLNLLIIHFLNLGLKLAY
jgi:hypothetical protein